VHELVTGTILLAIAIADGPDLIRRLSDATRMPAVRLRPSGPRSS